MRVNVYADPADYTLSAEDIAWANYHIGLEQGALKALQEGVPLDVLMGDFDSVSEADLAALKTSGVKMLTYPSEKDDSDTALAIQYALEQGATTIRVYGGIGNRLDHTYANLLWCKMAPVTFMNDVSKMYVLAPGNHRLTPRFKVVSFFALDEALTLSLEGFKYPLKDYTLTINDPLCLSNEGSGTVSFEQGLLLVIESNET